jgi:hypothetical protein
MSIGASESATTPAESSAHQSLASLQDAAKWVVGAFAAIGAILVAGLQVGAVGTLGTDEPLRLALALGAMVMALVAVGVVLTCAARVLVSPQLSLADLADLDVRELKRASDEEQVNPARALLGEPSDPLLKAIHRKREELLKSDVERPLELHGRLNTDQGLTDDQRKLLEEDAERLTDFADTLTARMRFKTLMWWLRVGGGLVAVCIVLFGWAINPQRRLRWLSPLRPRSCLPGPSGPFGPLGSVQPVPSRNLMRWPSLASSELLRS